MILNYFLLVIFCQYINADNQSPIQLAPKASATILNKQLVIYEPEHFYYKAIFNSSPLYDGNRFYLHHDRTRRYVENLQGQQYDYQFLNPSGSIQSKNRVYMIGSLQFKHRSLADASLAKRFSMFEINELGYKKSNYLNMTEPSFDHFPHFDYSSTLVDNLDENNSLSNTSLYILGGAKYFLSTRTTEIVRSFSRYNFQSHLWEDLTHLLPLNEFKPFAGHQVINVDNKKLIVLGGYRTTKYYDNYTIPYDQSELIDFQTIWIFDILNQKWEQQTTFYEGEDQFMSKREFYSFPATYRNNKLYMIREKYRNGRQYDKDVLFGILDLPNWHWCWKVIVNQHTDPDLSIYKVTVLVENYMLNIYRADLSYGNVAKVIDLDKEEFINIVKFPESISSGEEYIYNITWVDYLKTFLYILFCLVLPVFLILRLYKYYQSKGKIIVRFIPIKNGSDMLDIWSDETPLTNIDSKLSQSKSNTLQIKDTTIMMNLPHFQYEIDTRSQDQELPIPDILNEFESYNLNKSV